MPFRQNEWPNADPLPPTEDELEHLEIRQLRLPFTHRHDPLRLARLAEPVRDVYDCACGHRFIVYRGLGGGPDHTVEVTAGRSIDNVLIEKTQLSAKDHETLFGSAGRG